jgi:hypothetical protein
MNKRKKIDLTGQKFTELTVICEEGKNKHGQRLWKCICSCGKNKLVSTGDLKNGHNKSCGCLINGKNKNSKHPNHARGNKSPYWKGHGEISLYQWRHIKDSACSRNIEFLITIEEAWQLFLDQDKKCKLSGLDIRLRERAKDYKATASLDRIDSKKGYTIDNIQWIHKKINTMKMDLDEESFFYYCRLITEHRTKNDKS